MLELCLGLQLVRVLVAVAVTKIAHVNLSSEMEGKDGRVVRESKEPKISELFPGGSSGNATGISVDHITDLEPPQQDEDSSACSGESTNLIATKS